MQPDFLQLRYLRVTSRVVVIELDGHKINTVFLSAYLIMLKSGCMLIAWYTSSDAIGL